MSVASRRATDACRLPKMGDRARIDRVGLGALADGLGDGLEHDQIGLHYLERSPQLVEPSASARNNETLTTRTHGNVEAVPQDVDTTYDVHGDPSLSKRARRWAPATVWVRWNGRRGARLTNGLKT